MRSSSFIPASSQYENILISESYDIDRKKIKQISPGIDREIFVLDENLKRENILLSVGRIQEQKRQLDVLKFLDSFRKVDTNFYCYFVGGPSGKLGDDYLIQLKDTVKEFNLESHVEFLGNLTQLKIKELMNRSKLLIHTSHFETFGLVAIEANSMGVPVLTTNQGSLSELIENNVNGYLTEELVSSQVNNFVQNLLHDDKQFHKFQMNCHEKSKKFDWKSTAKELENLYKSVLI